MFRRGTPRAVGPRGRYRLSTALAEDALGSIWAARDVGVGREVTVRLLPAGLAEAPDVVAAVHQALRDAFPRLRDDRVLTTINYAVIDERHPYVVMESRDGPTLAETMRLMHRLSSRETTRVIEAVAGCLALAEALGIVHGALSPDSIVLDRDRAKVMDFGLWPITRLTENDWAFGAPEGGDPSPDADVFALAAIAQRIDVTYDDGGLPAALSGLLASALHPDPAHRPSAAMLAAAARAAGAEASAERGPAPATSPLPPPAREEEPDHGAGDAVRTTPASASPGVVSVGEADVIELRPAVRGSDGRAWSWPRAPIRGTSLPEPGPDAYPWTTEESDAAPTAEHAVVTAESAGGAVSVSLREQEGELSSGETWSGGAAERAVDTAISDRASTRRLPVWLVVVLASMTAVAAIAFVAASLWSSSPRPTEASPAGKVGETTQPTQAFQGTTVPDVLGMSEREATLELERADLVVSRVASVPGRSGKVVRTEPTPGEAVLAGTEVVLYVGRAASAPPGG